MYDILAGPPEHTYKSYHIGQELCSRIKNFPRLATGAVAHSLTPSKYDH